MGVTDDRLPEPTAVWPLDPTRLALHTSARRKNTAVPELPEPWCVEIGRRLLLAQLEFSEWVLRRVEKVTLEHDRSVSRNIAVDLCIRDDAPCFVSPTGGRLRLVPLSMMRRRTLVNLEIRDENGQTMTMPGLRLTQQLDQAILLAAAAAFDLAAALDPFVRQFVRNAIAGTHEEVTKAYEQFDRAAAGDAGIFPDGLCADPLFSAVVNRFRHNFTLYAFFADSTGGAHRLVRMSFDEPTAWLYQAPGVKGTAPGQVRYEPGVPRRWSRWILWQVWASLGFRPTRMRFQIPGAENAASYHFEITAPAGVHIVSATLLAGRPNEVQGKPPVDRIVGHSPTVGLHAIEVPSGSLCRVQVDLRATPQGWLTSMMFASLAVLLVMFAVGWHWGWQAPSSDPQVNTEQITNVVLILVTASAAVATLVAQRDYGEVGSRFVSGVRAVGIAAMALPAVTATWLVFSGIDRSGSSDSRRWVLSTLTAASVVPFVVVTTAWVKSVFAERVGVVEESPWDMTSKKPQPVPTDYTQARQEFGFDGPAVGVSSAEGWHSTYDWSYEKHQAAVESLDRAWRPGSAGPDGCAAFATDCAVRWACASKQRAAEPSTLPARQ